MLFTRYRLSPALVWHFRLLTQLVAEYHVAKLRERELEQVGYLRAVYETGARLTHDVKNLLQSLNNLCYVAQSLRGARFRNTAADAATVALDRAATGADAREAAPPAWWRRALQGRKSGGSAYASATSRRGRFARSLPLDATVPTALFDSVIDNLLQNALEKRKRSPASRFWYR